MRRPGRFSMNCSSSAEVSLFQGDDIGNKMQRRSLLDYGPSDVPSLNILPRSREIRILFKNLKACASSLRLEAKRLRQ